MADKPKPTEDGYTNAFWNVLEPYWAGGKYVMGAAEYIGIETLVSQVVRRAMKSPYNWRESLETHAYSVPMLGQLNFGEAYSAFEPSSKAKIELMDQATEGAKAIPAALIGYTAMKIRKEGVKIPSYANKDFLYLCVGKVLSRPLTAYLFSSLPVDFQVGLQVLNSLANRQKQVIEAVKESKKTGEDRK